MSREPQLFSATLPADRGQGSMQHLKLKVPVGHRRLESVDDGDATPKIPLRGGPDMASDVQEQVPATAPATPTNPAVLDLPTAVRVMLVATEKAPAQKERQSHTQV